MRRLFSVLLLLAAAIGIALPAPGLAQATVSAGDARAVQAVVRAQLDAFAADDAKAAFSFAAPNVREMFGTPERFMEMVRSGYGVVYRPASVAFMPPESSSEGVVQRVQMTDSRGASWLATYLLQRQKDKSWRISACVIAPNQGRAA
jgi:Domain of unknown function (DUF4864)